MSGAIVSPREATGYNLSLHPGGPKWSIVCGGCGVTFRHRLAPGIERQLLPCPHCGSRNSVILEWGGES